MPYQQIGGCYITQPPPVGLACYCDMPFLLTCRGSITSCKNKEDQRCKNPKRDKSTCEFGGGDCTTVPGNHLLWRLSLFLSIPCFSFSTNHPILVCFLGTVKYNESCPSTWDAECVEGYACGQWVEDDYRCCRTTIIGGEDYCVGVLALGDACTWDDQCASDHCGPSYTTLLPVDKRLNNRSAPTAVLLVLFRQVVLIMAMTPRSASVIM